MGLNIDFCIVQNPFNEKGGNGNLLIFCTKNGLSHVDNSIKRDTSYKAIIRTLGSVGYVELDECRFENVGAFNLKEKELSDFMELAGANYSKEFEETVNHDLNLLKDNLEKEINNNRVEDDDELYDDDLSYLSIEKTIHKLQTEDLKAPFNSEISVYVPKVNESVVLDMYLFIDLTINKNEEDGVFLPGISVGFDKNHTEKNSDTFKNLIKIISDSFTRVSEDDSSDVIEFVSTKTKGDLYNEIGFLHDIVISVSVFDDSGELMETNRIYNNILEFKNKIDLDEKVTFKVNKNDFSHISKVARDINYEKSVNQNSKTIYVDEVLGECEGNLAYLEDEMLLLAEEEEFKKAKKQQDKIEVMKEKVSFFEKEVEGREKISLEEFHTLLSTDNL